MPLETPSNAVGRIDVSQLVRPAEAVVEPRAVAQLTDAFRQGVVTADDVIARIGTLGKTREKAEVMGLNEQISPEAQALRAAQRGAGTAQAQLAQAQAERAKVLQEYPAVAYFDKLAPAAGIPEPKLPDGTPDYKQMEVIGAKLAVHEADKAQAQATLNNIEDVVHGNTSFSKTKQGEIVDQNYVAELRKKATSPFKLDAGESQAFPQRQALVEPNTPTPAPAPAQPTIEPQIAPAGTRIGMGTSLGPAATVPKAPTEAQQRAQLALSRFSQSGDIQKSLKEAGYDPTSIASWGDSFLPEVLKSGNRKQFDTAVDLWSQGLLRLESGAAISRQEKGWYQKAFFPQVNDPPAVVNAKEAARGDVERMVAEIAQQGGVISPESQKQAQAIYNQVDSFAKGATGAPGAAPAQNAVKVTSPEEARNLPPGTVFITPDGQQRVRK